MILLAFLALVCIAFYILHWRHRMPNQGLIKRVYKKGSSGSRLNDVIITLEIPATASRNQYRRSVSSDNWKCRASEAKVLAITGFKPYNKGQSYDTGYGLWDNTFKYTVGQTVKPSYFGQDSEACSGGIHFYMTRSKALRFGN